MITIVHRGVIWRVITIPKMHAGFVMINGELFEIRDIHCTSRGIQIELYP